MSLSTDAWKDASAVMMSTGVLLKLTSLRVGSFCIQQRARPGPSGFSCWTISRPFGPTAGD
jgi:hypothetical protein